MKQWGFCTQVRASAGNLHISLSGTFNGMCAWELIKTIRRHKAGAGRIFVDTAGIEAVMPDAVALFKHYMPRERLPSDWLYFKGKTGFKVAPNGSRVLIRNTNGGRRRRIIKRFGRIGNSHRRPLRTIKSYE